MIPNPDARRTARAAMMADHMDLHNAFRDGMDKATATRIIEAALAAVEAHEREAARAVLDILR